ncbi:acyltransferase [bacterium]|nr:acyltransferase [bacterium]
MNFLNHFFKKQPSYTLYILEDGVQKILKNPKIKGLKLKIQGTNNKIFLEKPFNFINCTISCRGNNNVFYFEKTKYFVSNLAIYANDFLDNRTLIIKENFSVNSADICLYSPNSKLTIGKDCMFSSDIKILTGDAHNILDKNGKILNTTHDMSIDNHVWLCTRSTIIKNVNIPKNCIIAAGSVVVKSFEQENSIIAGNPAKIVKRNINWER